MSSEPHESHWIVVDPGPYPPGEGPLDYCACEHGCFDLDAECEIEAEHDD